MLLALGLSIMFNTIGGQLDECLNGFLAICPIVIYILHVILVILVARTIVVCCEGVRRQYVDSEY